jgi:hypothetical protein
MKYKSGDFFYNTAEPSQNVDLLATFPFSNQEVIAWANNKGNKIGNITDIFDPQISGIILNPENNFKDTFLKGNMIFNSNFDQLTFNLTNPPATVHDETAPITGNIILLPKNKDDKPTVLEINSESKINWTQDSTNSWKPNFDVNTGFSMQYVPFTDSDGGISNIIMTSGNPRCKFRQTCTMNHWHYSGDCKTQIITSPDGTTSCKCACSGIPVFNSDPHSHCDPYTINPDGTADTPVGKSIAPGGLGVISTIHGIKMNLKSQFPPPAFGSAGGNVSLPFNDATNLKETDAEIRKIIYDYYFEVNKNIELQQIVQKKGQKDTTQKQSLMDATVQYKTEYLNVFNTVVGIFGVAGYIFLMSKS